MTSVLGHIKEAVKGNLDLNQLEAMLTERTKVIGVTQVSNVFGTIYPVKEIAEMAHRRGIAVVVDGAQSSPHLPIDVQGLGCDFFLGSGHKMYGPLGVGFIYGRREWLGRLEPAEGGSEMSESVTFTDWKPKPLPYKFEAGTPATGDAIAFATGLDYLNNLGMKSIEQYEKELVNYTTERLSQFDRVQVLGAGTDRVSIVSFTVDGMKPEQVGQYLDKKQASQRAGDAECSATDGVFADPWCRAGVVLILQHSC